MINEKWKFQGLQLKHIDLHLRQEPLSGNLQG